MNFLPHTYGALLFGAMAVNLITVMASTVIGPFLVEAGQSPGATGRLTALRMLVMIFCESAQGPPSGFLANMGFMWATVVNAVFALMIFPVAYFFLRERPCPAAKERSCSAKCGPVEDNRAIESLWMGLLFIEL